MVRCDAFVGVIDGVGFGCHVGVDLLGNCVVHWIGWPVVAIVYGMSGHRELPDYIGRGRCLRTVMLLRNCVGLVGLCLSDVYLCC